MQESSRLTLLLQTPRWPPVMVRPAAVGTAVAEEAQAAGACLGKVVVAEVQRGNSAAEVLLGKSVRMAAEQPGKLAAEVLLGKPARAAAE